MDFIDFLRAARRRWIVVATTVAVAMGVGLLSTTVVETGPPVRQFQATSVMLNTGSSSAFTGIPGFANLRTIAELATVGEVPERVAEELGYQGDPLELARQVRSVGNVDTGILRISATSTDPREAKRLADTFARQLVGFLEDRNAKSVNEEARRLDETIRRLDARVKELNRQIGATVTASEATLGAERDAAVTELTLAQQQRSSLANSANSAIELQIIQDGKPIILPEQGLLQVRSWPSRLTLAAILGLLAAGGIIFLLERFDTRIRNKDRAERAFELPVLAEVPMLTRRQARESGIVVTAKPKSVAADAYRILAAGITRRPPKVPQVIMVTSAGPGEGKTTTTANLAAAYAEVGRKVLIVSCDLHRPQIHRLLGVPNTKGLSDLLSEQDRREHLLLEGYVWKTPIDNVRVIPSGPAPANPAELLSSERMQRLIHEARDAADVVLLDTAPVLAVSDATSLFPETDAVVLSAWAGRTTDEAGRRTNDLLEQLGAQAVGVTLIAVADAALPRGYYQYYAPAEEPRRSRGSVSEVRGRKGF
jgi:capsular exopolysaccharide synthesis family protein